jgi:fibronectin type III domain protein
VTLAKKADVSLAWSAPAGTAPQSYLVEWSTTTGTTGSRSCRECFCEIIDMEPGDYTFTVRSVSADGQKSVPSNVVPVMVTDQAGAKRP